ncbi:MAG: 16S rRNA (guanine(966)-N(2))-methyltransferase RsmD [Lachnospiraceae bacterium]|nr:16S rRNA (guanine(966)-N(2))-methyltransferase RsmD [Lachnospiraceae bacterium]
MRVIAGTARSIKLQTIEGMNTRPTTDRTKETLFNVIGSNLYGIAFLDLFSGSGAIGIEALSRGAKKAYFVEENKKAVECIRKNLHHTKLEEDAVVLQQDVFVALDSLLKNKTSLDIIFMDPPYGKELEKKVLLKLNEAEDLDEDMMIVVESDLQTEFSYLEQTKFEVYKEKRYKTNKHTFIRIKIVDE